MRKSSKNKKNKVPKITEEQYANYVNSLKEMGQVCVETTNTAPIQQKQTKNESC